MAARVKNKAVADLQISAEQILLEAFERKEDPLKVPQAKIADVEELLEFQGRKRQEYEDALRRNRLNMGQWMRYAQFEIDQREFDRARSIFERALDVDYKHVPLWIRYIQTELKERNINHARNVLDRAVTLLPRIDKLWFTYVGVEETLSNISGARQVFERWMQWRPPVAAWIAYINMEKRYEQYERARRIFKNFTAVFPASENWIKWAKFEDEIDEPGNVRDVYTLAVDTLGQFVDEKLLVSWAKWEARQQEWERARAIYKFGLERLPKSQSTKLYNAYTAFEKQYGDKDGIEQVLLSKRRARYEEELKEDEQNYDTWWAYLSLLQETNAEPEEVREVYERAIACIPSENKKRSWRRYIFLWLRYAIYEELITRDIERARMVYQECVKIVPHKRFTFAKLWLLFAKFELRHNDTPDRARKVLGQALGVSKGQKKKLFEGYIEIEKKLKEFDRCRTLYEKYLENFADLPQPWIDYATLEQDLYDEDRARAIFELAITQEMEMPELVWKRYIEFETEEGHYDKARQLFVRLLEHTNHVKVWISYATFELSVPADDQDEDSEEIEVTAEGIANARKVYEKAWEALKTSKTSSKEQRVILQDSWQNFEESYGTEEQIDKVTKMKPNLAKKRRRIDDGTMEEYYEYIFPTDETTKSYSKLLENARKWAKAKGT